MDPSKSLKLEERIKRSKSVGPSKAYDIQDKLPIPQWKTFISNTDNKAALMNFVAESWIKNVHLLPQEFRLVLGGILRDPERAVVQTSTSVADIPGLSFSSHEEADTMIFRQLKYMVEHFGTKRAVIQSGDTDVILMALYHIVRMVELQELWVQKASVFLPCHELAQRLAVHTSMDNMH